MKRVDFNIPELDQITNPIETLYYKGNHRLLQQYKVSIVGTRKPNPYTQKVTYELSNELAKRGVCIVSGAAMGVDAIAHKGAGAKSTIAILPCGIDVRYPAINKQLIMDIEEHGLTMSQFQPEFKATPWSFVVRNELVVALGDILIVTQADIRSGSMRSVEYALKMGKKIFVLPHRLGDSEGTMSLLEDKKAELITDIRGFADRFGSILTQKDAFIDYCRQEVSYEEALAFDAQKLFEYELLGKIKIINGKVSVI